MILSFYVAVVLLFNDRIPSQEVFFVAEPCIVGWLRITTTVFIDYYTRSGPNPVRSEYRLGALYTGNILLV
jgi:hypothetical protein